jgi:hypothetical protein
MMVATTTTSPALAPLRGSKHQSAAEPQCRSTEAPKRQSRYPIMRAVTRVLMSITNHDLDDDSDDANFRVTIHDRGESFCVSPQSPSSLYDPCGSPRFRPVCTPVYPVLRLDEYKTLLAVDL